MRTLIAQSGTIRKAAMLLVASSALFVSSAFAGCQIEGRGSYTPTGNSYKSESTKWLVPKQGAKIVRVSNPGNAERIVLIYSSDGKTITSETSYYIKDLVGMQLKPGHYKFTPLPSSMNRATVHVSIFLDYSC
ncbi:hypothetical protein SAMN05660284_02703 [Formivibrio citricus]|uniref:Uncharacterized protein n=1 Tax=Formivibrio citricus TaxID=83765 RepID=A0A1I5DMM6_9NEIS|nr:hypothetical protein [Formivibrio citricus]SFO00367.1 hypothetical protein SAMN05660284_02703 [Formivibrio citricus]